MNVTARSKFLKIYRLLILHKCFFEKIKKTGENSQKAGSQEIESKTRRGIDKKE